MKKEQQFFFHSSYSLYDFTLNLINNNHHKNYLKLNSFSFNMKLSFFMNQYFFKHKKINIIF